MAGVVPRRFANPLPQLSLLSPVLCAARAAPLRAEGPRRKDNQQECRLQTRLQLRQRRRYRRCLFNRLLPAERHQDAHAIGGRRALQHDPCHF